MESFEVPLSVEGMKDSETPFIGVFIRAPVRRVQVNLNRRRGYLRGSIICFFASDTPLECSAGPEWCPRVSPSCP